MKKIMLFLMVCCLIGWTQANLAITNGDFETGGGSNVNDVTDWFDYNPTNFWEGAWQSNAQTPSGNNAVIFSSFEADDFGTPTPNVNDGSYLYQSIGTADGKTSIRIQFDWGAPTDDPGGRYLGLTIGIYAYDGLGGFTAADGTDVRGATGVTLLDSATYTIASSTAGGQMITGVTADLDLTGAGSQELFLRVNGYLPGTTESWPLVDNVKIPTIDYIAPTNGADLISPVRTDSDNDLVFDVVGPDIADVEVYLSANDPNAPTLIKTINSVGSGQQTVTLETELGSDLSFETPYYWKVIGYEPNTLIPANGNDIPVPGPVWSFTTAPEAPVITSDVAPTYTAVDAGEPNIVLSVEGINGDFQWQKDGSPIADAGGVYAGTTTNTLTIYDVQLADEGYYTCVISSLVGSDESAPGRVMIHRQTSYYDFESTSIVDGNSVFVDSIDGYHAVLMQESASAGLPTVTDANQADGPATFPGTNGLLLDNADHDTDPNGQYLQIYPGVVAYEDITIALWVHPKSVQQTWSHVWDFGQTNGPAFYLNVDYGATDSAQGYNAYSSLNGNNMIADLDSSNWVDPGTWHHVAVTKGDGTGKIYVDGVWYDSASFGSTPLSNLGDLATIMNYIGESQWANDQEWDGLIDELKIYNYARTNEQVAQDYMAYTGDSYICDTENNDLGNYDNVANGGNGNCKLDLPDLASMAARWLEADQFYPAP